MKDIIEKLEDFINNYGHRNFMEEEINVARLLLFILTHKE